MGDFIFMLIFTGLGVLLGRIAWRSKPQNLLTGILKGSLLFVAGIMILASIIVTVITHVEKPNSSQEATAGKIENQQSTPTKPDYESDLEERCKDWLFYRNRAYKLGREGDQKGSEQARRAMNQFYNDLRLHFSEKQISDEIAKLEAAGFKGGF